MKTPSIHRIKLLAFAIVFWNVTIPFTLWADTVELVNGDRYHGSVIRMDERELILQSEVQGRIQLPREKVMVIHLGTPQAPSQPGQETLSQPAKSSTKETDPLMDQLQKSGIDPAVLQQIESEFFKGMAPEVSHSFRETVQGFMSGTVTVDNIRAQARESVDQIRSVQADLGEEAGELLNGYLFILDNFLKKTDGVNPNVELKPTSEKK